MGNLKSSIEPEAFLRVGDLAKPGVLGAVAAIGRWLRACFEGGNEWLLNTGDGSEPKGARRGNAAD
ncbi:hypothetical protein RRF57_005174 [Xylaria bambusicola]|uniref:Uncharacterized protein n=1 Tax=Xylaria bambusicola TaxID=326684 RepID=A0AAN7UPM1_9PEZI